MVGVGWKKSATVRGECVFDILFPTPSHLSQLPVGHALSLHTPLCAPHHDALSQHVSEVKGPWTGASETQTKQILHPSGVLSQQWLRSI